jgi:ABC-type transport system involved in cytochrome bd biosynthesis fused ATPase/permease subunit
MNANVQLKPLDNDILNKLNLEPDFISYLKENGTFEEISKLAGEAATVDPMLRGRNIKLIQKIIKRGRIGEEINKDLERDLENESPYIQIKNCTENNLKDVTANIPVRCFVAVTGVSGSGKSTLINDILSNYLMNYFYDSRLPVGKHGEILGLENIDKVQLDERQDQTLQLTPNCLTQSVFYFQNCQSQKLADIYRDASLSMCLEGDARVVKGTVC